MRKIVYYAASTLDGYICGPDESIEGYVDKGSGLDQYLSDLKKFDSVIMGRKTYEFGFKYGLTPGMPAYEHMDHYIFSNSAAYKSKHEKVHIIRRDLEKIKSLKNSQGSDIYLCGGGIFAGWLLNNKMIDELKLKLSPVLFGAGTKLFEGLLQLTKTELISEVNHDYGMKILTYKILY
jgi:dihydrofolate reductase